MRRGIVLLACLFAAALLAACGLPTDANPSRATLTAMSNVLLPSVTPVPASATPQPTAGDALYQGWILFARRNGSASGIYKVRPDGSGLARAVVDLSQPYSASVSPDGRRLAYVAQKDGSYGVFIADVGGPARRLDVGGSGSALAWSPDGEKVVLSAREGLGTELYVLDVKGGEPQQLTDSALHKTGPAWSSDGGWIAFTMLDNRNQGEVWVMPAPGGAGEPVNLTQHPANDCCLAWSPDSRRLAFLSSRAGEGVVPVGDLVRTAYGAGLDSAAAPRPLTTVVPEAPQDIYVVDRDGSGLRNLTGDRGRERGLAWSPGGRRLAYASDQEGGWEIYVMDVDAGGRVRLTRDEWPDSYPVWSPDGSRLAFISYREDGYGIYLVDLPAEPGGQPGEPWKLVKIGISNGVLAWSP